MRYPLSLWRDGDFVKLWTGQTVSRFGSGITYTALELTALLLLGATPFQMGLLVSIAAAPTLLAGSFVGNLVDRCRRRPLMIGADLLRAALLATIPLAAWFGSLQFAHLLVVATTVGVLNLVFEVSQQTYVPSLVGDRLLEANAKLGASNSVAEVAATGLAGLLVQLLTAPFAILIDCATYLVSALSLTAIRTPERQPAPTEDGGPPISGFSVVLHHPVLRALAAYAVTDRFFGNFIGALYTIYCVRLLGMDPILLGLSISFGGVGSLIGASAVDRLIRRWGVGNTAMAALAVGGLASFLLPAAGGPLPLAFGIVAVCQLVADAAGSVYGVATLSVRQTVAPASALGRVNGAMYLLDAGIGPLGALVGGFLGGAIGVRETLVLAVVGFTLGKLWVVFSPVRQLTGLGVAGAT